MTTEENQDKKVECPYCGKLFENKTEEGIHRTEKHISTDQKITGKNSGKGNSIVDKWKREGSKA